MDIINPNNYPIVHDIVYVEASEFSEADIDIYKNYMVYEINETFNWTCKAIYIGAMQTKIASLVVSKTEWTGFIVGNSYAPVESKKETRWQALIRKALHFLRKVAKI